MKTPWIRPRKYWFVLTPDSLDYYSSNEKGARRLGSLVLTSLCSVLWPDKQTYKETGKAPAPSSREAPCALCHPPSRGVSITQRRGCAQWWAVGELCLCLCPLQVTGA